MIYIQPISQGWELPPICIHMYRGALVGVLDWIIPVSLKVALFESCVSYKHCVVPWIILMHLRVPQAMSSIGSSGQGQ